MDNLELMENEEFNEIEARRNALRQLINQTSNDYSAMLYANMASIDIADIPEKRREWLLELRELDGIELSLQEHQAEGITDTREILARTLETPLNFNGRLFNVTMEKQNLLSAQLGLFGLNAQAGIPTELTWNATGEPCEPWAFEDLLTLSNAIKAHVTPLVMLQRDAEVEIKGSKTREEIRNIIAEYRLALASAINE